MSSGSGWAWNEYWGWDLDPNPPPPPADPPQWDEWSVHGACPQWPTTTTSWGWSVWDNPLAIASPDTHDINNPLEELVEDGWSNIAVGTEAPDLEENDFFYIDDEDRFTVTAEGESMCVHMKLPLADALALLSNLHPDKIPDPEFLFNDLCMALGFNQVHGQPRPASHFFPVGTWPILAYHLAGHFHWQ
jgi:hypothetical protein